MGVYNHGVICAIGLEEYCLFDTFGAECPHNQVILMTEARYGLMNMGKCVKTDSGLYIYICIHVHLLLIYLLLNSTHLLCYTLHLTGKIGCSVDALPYLDKVCSDQPRCEYYVVDKELAKEEPCSSDNKPYVELDYICIDGKLLKTIIVTFGHCTNVYRYLRISSEGETINTTQPNSPNLFNL